MKLPSMQFYPGDYLKDAELRLCSPAARGVWMDILCLMFEAKRRGVLRAKTIKKLSKMVSGCKPKYIQELIDNKVMFVAPRSGAFYSKRLIRDEIARRRKAFSGRKGGKQTASKTQANREAKRGSSSSSSSSVSASPSNKSNSATAVCQHLNTLVREWTGSPLPKVTEEKIREKLFVDLSPEEAQATTAGDLKASVENWRAHQTQARRRNQTEPNYGLGYLKNILIKKKDKKWLQEKNQPAGPAANLVQFQKSDPRMSYWHSLSRKAQQVNVAEIKSKHPEITTWPQARDRWLTENFKEQNND